MPKQTLKNGKVKIVNYENLPEWLDYHSEEVILNSIIKRKSILYSSQNNNIDVGYEGS
jgi:hypothetical protein